MNHRLLLPKPCALLKELSTKAPDINRIAECAELLKDRLPSYC